jgi:hypothetical protein
MPIRAATEPHPNVMIGMKIDGRLRERIILDCNLSILHGVQTSRRSSYLDGTAAMVYPITHTITAV